MLIGLIILHGSFLVDKLEKNAVRVIASSMGNVEPVAKMRIILNWIGWFNGEIQQANPSLAVVYGHLKIVYTIKSKTQTALFFP